MRSTALNPTSSLGFVNADPRALATAVGPIDDLLKAAPERTRGSAEPHVPGGAKPALPRSGYAGYYAGHDAGHGDVVSVPHVLLALLSEGPKYGLQLREEFEAGTGEVWPLNVGQVYKTLGRLERDGLAESDGTEQEGPQKRFRITAGGRRALAGWLRTPPDLTSPPRDELVMKVLVAARVPGTDAHEVIQAHRVYLLELMQQWTRLKEGEAHDDLSLALVVDSELFRLDAVIRWLDAAEVRLERAANEPPRPASAPVPVPQLRRLGARR